MADDMPTSLDRLREDIDRVDGQLHALLRERAALVNRVAVAKRAEADGAMVIVRPGREAALLRKLIGRHEGALPAAVVAAIWREIVSAACVMQGNMRVALYAPERSISHWDLARNHFGSLMPIQLCGSPQRVLQEAGDNGAVGVLPWPEHDEAQPWWPNLAAEDSEDMNIVGVLPFFESASGRFEGRRLMVVATYPPEESGDDISYLLVQADPELSRARLHTLLDGQGLTGGILVSQDQGGTMRHLLEIDGFVAGDDGRVAALAADEAIRSVKAVGAAPRPLGLLDEQEKAQ